MTPLKLNVLFATFSYGGNGGFKSEHPDVGRWLVKAHEWSKHQEPRIGTAGFIDDLADTPIPMCRNRAMKIARENHADVLIMVDSDQSPDYLLGYDKNAVPFLQSSFDFLYEKYQTTEKGVMVASPYCGPPPNECVYAFRWKQHATDPMTERDMQLEMYERTEAYFMSGIQNVDALATGLLMIDLRLLELTDPMKDAKYLVEKEGLTLEQARERVHGWCHYEWRDVYQSEKASTEDVVFSRDIALACVAEHGYNPCFVNWSAWAGHWKPKLVGKPAILTSSDVGTKFKAAASRGGKDETIQSVETDPLKHFEKMGYTPVTTNEFGQIVLPTGEVIGEPSGNGAPKPSASNGGNGAPEPSEEPDPWEPVLHQRLVNGIVLTNYGPMTTDEHLNDFREVVHEHCRSLGGKRIDYCEVGVWLGDQIVNVYDLCRSIVAVDTWEGSPESFTEHGQEWLKRVGSEHLFQLFQQNVRPTYKQLNFDVIKLPSVEAAKRINEGDGPRETFDVVLIDGDHSYEGVQADIEAWYPLVRDGGLLVGHDFGTSTYPGVEKAVRERFDPEYGGSGGFSTTQFRDGVGSFWIHSKVPEEAVARE